MARSRVGLAGCRRVPGGVPGDLYPNPDLNPLLAALADSGASGCPVAWDDPTVTWDQFDRVVVSGTWDSVDRPDAYLDWARAVAATTVLVNDPIILAWGLDKHYLQTLQAAGIPVVATTWLEPGQPWRASPGPEIVVKPAVSAGSRHTARYVAGDGRAASHVEWLHRGGQTALVQEYVQNIDREGEINLIYFGGAFSHAVKKCPALVVGKGPVARPWERMAWDGIVTPTIEQLTLGVSTMAVVTKTVGRTPVYGRVDLVDVAVGRPQILEVELVDPYLSLDLQPGPAPRLVAALLGDLSADAPSWEGSPGSSAPSGAGRRRCSPPALGATAGPTESS